MQTSTAKGLVQQDADAVIARLSLQPHPEGGWFRETWRAPAGPNEDRGRASAILFLLRAGQPSRWHRIDAAELWLFNAGAPLTLSIAPAGGGSEVAHRLGADVLAGEVQQQLVPPGDWQAAATTGAWSLVSCVVSPAFVFDTFVLAPPGWAPPRGG